MANGMAMAHFVSRFPTRSETFVLGEMAAFTRCWPQAHVFAFFKQPGEVPAWVQKVHYLPPWGMYPLSQMRFLARSPRRYFGLLRQVISGHRGNWRELAKALLLWPKGVRAAELIEREGIDALHAHWSNVPATVAFVAAGLLDKNFTMTAHAFDIYKKSTFLGEKMARARLCFTCTDCNRRTLLRRYADVDPERIKLVYHGVDTELFTPGPAPPTPPLVLLTIGRLVRQKGFPTLLRALGALVKDGVLVRLRFLALPGPLEGEVRALVRELCLEGMVEWLDPRPAAQMPQLYREAHAFVLPCEIGPDQDRDGIPNVLFEAMASGLPVISAHVSGVPELVANGVNGLLVKPSDSVTLAGAIRRLAEDEGLRKSLGEAARRDVVERFDRRACQRQLLAAMELIDD